MHAIPPRAPDREDSPAWPDGAAPAPPVRWRDRLTDAFRGIKLGMRGHSSFSVHFFFATLAITAAIVLQCRPLEYALLVGSGGLVLITELFNSALVKLFDSLEPAAQERAQPTLLIASGAVLLASVAAVVVGALIFLPKLATLFLQ